MHRWRSLLLALPLASLPASGSGQDLIVNGHFHTDIAGWTLVGVGTQAWDPLDWQADPGSGSIRVTNTNPAGNQITASGRCIPLTPSGTFEAGVHVRFPSGQVAFGAGAVGVAWFNNPTCTDPPISTVNSPAVLSTTTNTWVESFMGGFVPPAGTVAAGVGPGVGKVGAGGSLVALFDRVRFGLDGTTPVGAQTFSVE